MAGAAEGATAPRSTYLPAGKRVKGREWGGAHTRYADVGVEIDRLIGEVWLPDVGTRFDVRLRRPAALGSSPRAPLDRAAPITPGRPTP
jgi:hypothetical protein